MIKKQVFKPRILLGKWW